MTPQPQRDARFDKAVHDDLTLGLSRADAVLRGLAAQAALPGTLGARVRAMYAQRVEATLTRLRDKPFLQPPVSISEGRFTIGDANGKPFCLTEHELLRHTLITGPSGSGKTTLVQHHATQLRAAGKHLIVPDYKGDLQWLAATDQDFIVFHPDIPFNILEHDKHTDRDEHIDRVVRLLAASFYGGEHFKQVGHETLRLAYKQHGTPSITDWLAVAKALVSPKDTYQRRDALSGLIMRLERLVALYPGMATVRHGIPHHVIAERSVYVGAPHHNETYDFLGALLVTLCHQQSATRQERDKLTRYVIIDEGLLTFGDSNRIDGPVLLPLIPQLREYGTGVTVTTAHLGGIHETLRANTYTTILLPLTNATDAGLAAKTLGLNNQQARHVLRLTLGQAIVRTGKWEQPFLITFPPPQDKTVQERDWQAAIERTNQLAPKPTTIAPVLPAVPPKPAPTPKAPPVVALNNAQQALLAAVADLIIPTSTQAYKHANLTLSAGDASAKHSETLGLLTRTPITARPGRGGNAIALELTNVGYERLNKKPPRGTRGGDSAQHRYLTHHLAQHIKASTVEATLGVGGKGGKSVDVLVRITPDHERLRQVIAHNAHHLSSEPHSITNGDLIAIEIEVSDPNRTASPNALANHEHGIQTTVVAVMPKALEATKKHLLKDPPTEVLSRIVVVDALQLLEGLREDAR